MHPSQEVIFHIPATTSNRETKANRSQNQTQSFCIIFFCFLLFGEQEDIIEINQFLYLNCLRRVVDEDEDDLDVPGRTFSIILW